MIGIGIGISPSLGTGNGARYEPETVLIFEAASAPISQTDKRYINNIVKSLKAAEIWDELRFFSLFAVADQQLARINWKNPSEIMTAVNSPSFTAYRGFAGDGATSYLETGIANNNAAPYGQNDAHLSEFVVSSQSDSNFLDIGGGNAYINARNTSGSMAVRANFGSPEGAPTGIIVSTAVGLSWWSRDNSATFKQGKNSTTPTVQTRTSSGLSTATITVGKVGALYSPRTIGAVSFGGALSDAQMASLYSDALLPWMQRVGAV